MTINSHIIDSKTKMVADVVIPYAYDYDKITGLSVYTEPRRKWKHMTSYFYNDAHGIDMNINASSPDIIEKIHNGEDDLLWDAANTSRADFIFNSSTVTYSGVGSIDATATIPGSVCEFTKSTDLNFDNYGNLSGWIYLISVFTGTINMQFKLDGVYVGNSINIGDYVNSTLLNTWQYITINKSDFGTTGTYINSLEISVQSPGIDFYLDELALTGTLTSTGTQEFCIYPVNNRFTRILAVKYTLVGEYNSTITDGTMPRLSHNKLINLDSLLKGIYIRTVVNGEVIFLNRVQMLLDFIEYPCFSIEDYGYDGTYTWVTIYMNLSNKWVTLSPNTTDKMCITIDDDLSGLTRFRATATMVREILPEEYDINRQHL